jgi:hypothetical protein
MSNLVKLLHSELFESKTFFSRDNYKNMHEILNQINESFNHIKQKGEKMGMKIDEQDETRKKILAKCMSECVVRHVYSQLKIIVL